MIPQQTFESYPVFGDNATKVAPDSAKYSAGFQQADVLPAEWMNWAWNKNTKGVTDLNAGLDSVEKEIINVLGAASVTPAQATNNQLLTSINYLISQAEARAKVTAFNTAHPIGEVYVQFPQQDDPETLYNKDGITSTWTLIDYDGAFFRASGGNAAAFLNKTDVLTKQAQATAKGGLEVYSASSGGTASTTSGMSANSTGSAKIMYKTDSYTRSGNMTMTSGSTIGTTGASAINMGTVTLGINVAHSHNMYLRSSDSETRPVNYTIKVWKRTAQFDILCGSLPDFNCVVLWSCFGITIP